jgi:DNA-binding CsgD family transcriptional regulator
VTTDWFFSILNAAPYGAYAVDLDQTILFWNRSAERILGHKAEGTIGRRCCQVLQNFEEGASTPICLGGCPSIESAKAGRDAPIVHAWMLCASGQRRLLTVTPFIIPQARAEQPVLVHLFHERDDDVQARRVAGAVRGVLSERRLPHEPNDLMTDVLNRSASLTIRETEVLRLVALGLSTQEIANDTYLSVHTVRNYVRNAREKLQAKTTLAVVMAAQRLGLL